MNESVKMADKCKKELRDMYYDGMITDYGFATMDNYLSMLVEMITKEGGGVCDNLGYNDVDGFNCYGA